MWYKMRLTNRNTYHERKIMLIYDALVIMCMTTAISLFLTSLLFTAFTIETDKEKFNVCYVNVSTSYDNIEKTIDLIELELSNINKEEI